VFLIYFSSHEFAQKILCWWCRIAKE
jgi:hypothetical protein